MSPQAAADHVELLAREKARFLRFLERRVANRADAEDLLQTALLKVATETVPLPFEGGLVPWFYQVLRNLLVDHYRRAAALGRAKQRASAEARATVDIDDDLFRAICACVNLVAATLKPQYAELLRRIELEEEPVRQVAHDLRLTPNNVSVRLHRARRALRAALQVTCGACAEHGCLDCSCRHTARNPHGAGEVPPPSREGPPPRPSRSGA